MAETKEVDHENQSIFTVWKAILNEVISNPYASGSTMKADVISSLRQENHPSLKMNTVDLMR